MSARYPLDRYEDVFNEWDPAPYKRRDLDPDLLTYLHDCSLDIPLRYELSLAMTVPPEVADAAKEKLVGDGIRNYFAFEARQTRRRVWQRAADENLLVFSYHIWQSGRGYVTASGDTWAWQPITTGKRS